MSFSQAMGAPPQPRPQAMPGGGGGGNPLQAKFQQTMQGAQELIQVLTQTPGVDQAKLKQAVTMLVQGMQMLSTALPGQGQQQPGPPGG